VVGYFHFILFEDKSISSMIWIFRRRARLLIRFVIHFGIFFVECYIAFHNLLRIVKDDLNFYERANGRTDGRNQRTNERASERTG